MINGIFTILEHPILPQLACVFFPTCFLLVTYFWLILLSQKAFADARGHCFKYEERRKVQDLLLFCFSNVIELQVFRLTCIKLCTCTPKTSQWLYCSACYLKIAAKKISCFQLLQYFRKLCLLSLLIFSHNFVPSWGEVQLKIIACFVFFCLIITFWKCHL